MCSKSSSLRHGKNVARRLDALTCRPEVLLVGFFVQSQGMLQKEFNHPLIEFVCV